ncbi:MAG: hypothetical protein A2096_14695 [Spirochaetes bacterium GWF1_41_5]|nr:MAG: hypothetical protein A2096_14695 [Spirochaetes bacterium GWF1_41_5]HBE03876.1 hypothetical protein [Spirochaetia bacterium]
MPGAEKTDKNNIKSSGPVIGVFATADPRVDKDSRIRAANIVKMTADLLAGKIKFPDGSDVKIVYSELLLDGEKQADIIAENFRQSGVNILVCVPDTWAFPQLSLISLLSHFPSDTPVNLTCGNSGPKPGVVFTHAAAGAISQYGKLVHINVGTWPDTGHSPVMTAGTAETLIDWAYAAITFQGLKGRRVAVLGHDSMGMETALAHVIASRNTFGLEITRLDMKLLSDMLAKKAWDQKELDNMVKWIFSFGKEKVELRNQADEERFKTSLAMYLIVRDLMKDLNAVGGGFMSQLEWGSDRRGLPLPVADIMESLFNSTFDHNGRKAPLPYGTEADVQGLFTMLFYTWLSGGNPSLFMDFRKVWEPWEINKLAESLGIKTGDSLWSKKGLVDGDNSGSASFDWAALPGANIDAIMKGIRFPAADEGYFPGLGNSVFFVSPAGIRGIAGRLAYSSLSGIFSMVWDEAETTELPEKLSQAVYHTSTPTWPHTYVVPKYATMGEYKQYAPANHFHMTWNLPPRRLQFWMDMANVLSVTPWQNRPGFIEGTDRPLPLLYLLNGGELNTKMLLRRK